MNEKKKKKTSSKIEHTSNRRKSVLFCSSPSATSERGCTRGHKNARAKNEQGAHAFVPRRAPAAGGSRSGSPLAKPSFLSMARIGKGESFFSFLSQLSFAYLLLSLSLSLTSTLSFGSRGRLGEDLAEETLDQEAYRDRFAPFFSSPINDVEEFDNDDAPVALLLVNNAKISPTPTKKSKQKQKKQPLPSPLFRLRQARISSFSSSSSSSSSSPFPEGGGGGGANEQNQLGSSSPSPSTSPSSLGGDSAPPSLPSVSVPFRKRRDWSLGPALSLDADAALRMQMDALARNDDPYRDHGVEVRFFFFVHV